MQVRGQQCIDNCMHKEQALVDAGRNVEQTLNTTRVSNFEWMCKCGNMNALLVDAVVGFWMLVGLFM